MTKQEVIKEIMWALERLDSSKKVIYDDCDESITFKTGSYDTFVINIQEV